MPELIDVGPPVDPAGPARPARTTGGPGRVPGRRQLGSDRRTEPLPAVARPPSRRAISAARFAIVFTMVAWVAYAADQLYRVAGNPISVRVVIDTLTYFTVVTLLTVSALAYLVTRLGYLYRIRDHHRVPRASIDDHFGQVQPTLTAIIPSYREEARVVRQTLLSSALQEYPAMNIVLLIDDPPNPSDAENQALLAAARALPGEIQDLLDGPHRRFEAALVAFEARGTLADDERPGHLRHLADLYDEAAAWLFGQADAQEIVDHTDVFLADAVLGRLGREMLEVATALRLAAAAATPLSDRRIVQLHRRLAWTFRAELSSFERKQYASLSSEPNKAMNLNSYIGLMGHRYRVQDVPSGPVLFLVDGDDADLAVPDPDYVLTLDADSTLLPEYCLRLVYLLDQPDATDIAVAQTPYSAYPGARSRVERISGASTDIQHIVHQGLTRDHATFWVGANAVLRKKALDDICELDHEDGLPIKRYIQDRTPIEDTESSIDISLRGWRLYNFPERLSYSATPPDFGSLCVQRQRWANGGLIMLPKFWQLMRMRWHQIGLRSVREGFLRLNYLASIAWASFGLIVLLVYPYDSRLISPVAMLAAVPYFVATSTDLRRSGYRRTDVLRIYGFNLLLLPVNTSGVIKSIEQSIGGQKIAFARTPKVRSRTVAPMLFVLIPYLIVGLSAYTVWHDLQNGHLSHAAFAGANAVLTMYAIVAFVGVRFSLADMWANIVERLYVPAAERVAPTEPDWVSVLYYGSAETTRSSTVGPRVAALALVDQEPAAFDGLVGDPREATAAPGAAVAPAPRRRTPQPSRMARLTGRVRRGHGHRTDATVPAVASSELPATPPAAPVVAVAAVAAAPAAVVGATTLGLVASPPPNGHRRRRSDRDPGPAPVDAAGREARVADERADAADRLLAALGQYVRDGSGELEVRVEAGRVELALDLPTTAGARLVDVGAGAGSSAAVPAAAVG